jgi:hypothetical protein
MKTIEAWAAVNEVGNIINITWTESVRNLWNSQSARIVKLTGEVPEPKKPKLMAPALAKWHERTRIELTLALYESEEAARKDIGKFFISWPAVPKDGMYEVME